jgi:Ran GTPase-activating protein (RanGAP) involved in mRNA processing and transport
VLSLKNNQIEDRGAQYLGDALQEDMVRQIYSLHFCLMLLSYFLQTLTELQLSGNQIGDKGAEYLEKLNKNDDKIVFI